MYDGYSNEAQRHCAALSMGLASNENPKHCACHGGGWILSSYDTWVSCPMHQGIHPEDAMREAEHEAYEAEQVCAHVWARDSYLQDIEEAYKEKASREDPCPF